MRQELLDAANVIRDMYEGSDDPLLAAAEWLEAQARVYFNGTGLCDKAALKFARAIIGDGL